MVAGEPAYLVAPRYGVSHPTAYRVLNSPAGREYVAKLLRERTNQAVQARIEYELSEDSGSNEASK